ncbi:MAG: dTDP-4-dehydrorhamnose 3,5-epimerase family protein [candidate division Zixibacteria bacterium]|nr:dTDP-4-dehydrorhamnose 3,5-epimerase family protein [candidate division Zixibacteria bacterium]
MKCDIEGVLIKELVRHTDERGWLMELFRQDELEEELYPAMSYVSLTEPGQVRGPHEHREQTDFFVFFRESHFRLFLWDNRKKSPSFGKTFQLETGAEKDLAVLVPPGVVHAYKNMGPDTRLVFNAPNRLYRGEERRDAVDEIRHEDDPNSPFKIPG